VSNFEPDAAVVLNITQDHLDWHGLMAAYAAAKARIYGQQAVMVINRDDPEVAAMVPPPEVSKSGVRGRPTKTRPPSGGALRAGCPSIPATLAW
jgi:UDP-N-acetylmuramoylalanine--D-glutamate ligase